MYNNNLSYEGFELALLFESLKTIFEQGEPR